jgi:alpha-1,2-mannosyltransferase
MVSDATLRRFLSASTVALAGDLVRGLLWGLAVVLWIAFAQVYLRMIRLTLGDPSSSDFTIFYFTARMVADGLPMYGESPARYGVTWAAEHLGNLNPPHFQILFVPLARLPYGQALLAWVAISFTCLVASMVVIFRELRVPFSWPRFVAWAACTIGLAPFTTVAVTSEMTFVLMLPFALQWRAWRRGDWATAGAWLGVLASLKLFFLVFVGWLVLRRQWRALGACAASLAALVLLGSVVFGSDAYRLWTQSLGTVGWQWMAMNASWPGYVSRLLQGGTTIEPATLIPWLVQPIALFGVTFILAATVRSTWRKRDDVAWREWVLLVLLLCAILASPLGWVYYLPLAYAPVLGWMGAGDGWAGLKKLSKPALAALVIAIALLYIPQEVANAAQPSNLATLTLASAYFYATVVLWATLIRNRPN